MNASNVRLVTFDGGVGLRAGLVVGGRVHDAARLLRDSACSAMPALLQRWSDALPLLASSPQGSGVPLSSVRLLAPVPHPGAIFCAGANYADHVAFMARKLGLDRFPNPRDIGSRPYHFSKPARCCVGPDVSVAMPSRDLDWEAELVAVIGRPARRVSTADALQHVAGYTIGNDLSARDRMRRAELPGSLPFHFDWLEAKGFEHAAPTGPWIVPAAAIGNGAGLRIGTSVNGVVKQDSSTSEMIFTVAEQIAYLSEQTTLEPGDLVFTGTPAGAGAENAEFLTAGDVVTVSIEGIGELTTRIVARS